MSTDTYGVHDTSVFVAAESGRTLDREALPLFQGVSVVTVGELRAGVLAAAGDAELLARRMKTLESAALLTPLPVDEAVAEAWALLRIRLRDAGERMGVNDSWIAATAMAHDAPVITQDDGFPHGIEGLRVIRV